MPPKKKKSNPPPEPSQQEQELMQGHPEHGEEYTEETQEQEQEEEQEQQEQQAPPEPQARPDPFAELRAELRELRQMIPPANQPQKETPPAAEENEPDWDRLLFDNPREALRLHGERVAKQVRDELQSEYQRDQGTQRFWGDFFEKNPDLKGDRDLVELTLNSNLSKLANLPVSEAIDQLADLTRQRILRYSGGQSKKGGKKAVVEGAEAPSPKPPEKEESSVVTLTDLIKARRAKRTTAA